MSDAFDQGITVTEIAAMDLPINVALETTAAFAGRALRGPLNTPVLIKSFAAFQRRFGGVWHRSSLGPAVQQFFEHGGSRLYVVRVANGARGSMIALPATGGVLVLHALEPGSTENIRAAVDYDGIDSADDQHFNLVVQRVAPDTGLVVDQEIFSHVSCDDRSVSYIGFALTTSSLVWVQTPAPHGRPAATVGDDAGFAMNYVGHAQHGSDGLELSDYDLIGSRTRGTGIFALNQLEHFDLLYLPPPARGTDIGPTAVLAAEQFCRRRGAMLVMDPPESWDTPESAVEGIRNAGYASANIVGYFPRVTKRHGKQDQSVTAGGALAGLLCKLDRIHGAWEDLDQPGIGVSRALKPVLELNIDEAKALVREGLNVIAGHLAGRASVCGSVTMGPGSQMDRRYSSLTVRRLCLMITNSIERATRWAVFELNGSRVAERIYGQVDGFMSYLANAGAFADDHFVVHCETELRSSTSDPDHGITILLAFRPAGTNEEIAITLHQTISGCRTAATAFAPVTAKVA